MSTLPSDLTSRVAEEITLGTLFRTAWRQHKRYFWPAVGLWLLRGLIIVGVGCLMCCIVWPVMAGIMGAGGGFTATPGRGPAAMSPHVQNAIEIALQIAMILPQALLLFPIFGGYLWSVVCSYDGRGMQAGDLFAGFRQCYRQLATLGFLWAVGMAASNICVKLSGVTARFASASGASSVRGPLAIVVVGLGFAVLMLVVTELLTYLTPMLPFTQSNISVGRCLRSNWLALSSRPLQFIVVAMLFWAAVVVFYVALILVVILAVAGGTAAGGPGAAWSGMVVALLVMIPLLLVLAWVAIFCSFLRAAFFRSVCGYTLTEPGQDAGGFYEATPVEATPIAGTGPAATPTAAVPDTWPELPPIAPDDDQTQQPPASSDGPDAPWPAPRNDPPPWDGR